MFNQKRFPIRNQKEENKMKRYEVIFNKKEVILKDNRQFCFKTKDTARKNYHTTTDKNSFSITMIAENFVECLEKANKFFSNRFNKKANSVEVKLLKIATNSSTNLNINNQKLVA